MISQIEYCMNLEFNCGIMINVSRDMYDGTIACAALYDKILLQHCSFICYKSTCMSSMLPTKPLLVIRVQFADKDNGIFCLMAVGFSLYFA